MASNGAQNRVKRFVALSLIICDVIHFHSAEIYPAQNTTLTSIVQQPFQKNGFIGSNIPEEKQSPTNIFQEMTSEVLADQPFFIHLQVQNSRTNHSGCFLLNAAEKSTQNVVDENRCNIIINDLDSNSLEILNNQEIFCQDDDNLKYQARIEQTAISDNTRCESMETVRKKHNITSNGSKTTILSDIFNKICKNMLSTKIDYSEKTTCIAFSKTYFMYRKEQCCTGSFRFIPRGAFQIEAVMLWIHKNNFSYFVEFCFALSFVSLCIIFLSALVSRTYRAERGNQILIHFAFSIFAQIMLHAVGCFIKISPFLCELQSISFHYFTLVESCWTSIIAYLQYKRFVKVFDNEPNHLILKLCAIAYIPPILPITLWITFQELHLETINYITFGLPEFLTLIINSTILILITKNIVFVRNEFIEHKKSLSMEVKLIFFLFFVLDFSWFQIILAHATSNKYFIYLFLITQSMQGFMLFFVFGIMNDHNRLIYKKFFTTYLGKIFKC